jgi:hypothetical protein
MDERKRKGIEESELSLFRPLWKWERVLYGQERAKELEALVRSDLATLRAQPRYDSQSWSFVVRMGYEQMLKDPAALEELHKEVLDKAPNSCRLNPRRRSGVRRRILRSRTWPAGRGACRI